MVKYGLLILSVIILISAIIFVARRQSQPAPLPSSRALVTNSPSPTSSPPPASSQPTIKPSLVYPMTKYTERVTVRSYGRLVKPGDQASLPCGAAFSGFHTGDDLEVFPNERDQDVPVFAIAAGQVIEAQTVSGYGGLVVIRHDNVGGQSLIAYYGHLNLARVTVKPPATVQAGQQIGVLGAECSTETDHERKHLHFALRPSGNDVPGYAPTEAVLKQWVDPSQTLKAAGAQNPG